MNILPSLSKIIRRRLLYASAAIFVAISFGAIGFFLIEGFSLLDSFYLATETVTTVGYGDITPHTDAGKIFTIFYVIIGIGILATFANLLIKRAMTRRQVKKNKALHS